METLDLCWPSYSVKPGGNILRVCGCRGLKDIDFVRKCDDTTRPKLHVWCARRSAGDMSKLLWPDVPIGIMAIQLRRCKRELSAEQALAILEIAGA